MCLWDDSRGISRSNSKKVPEERGEADKSSPRARRGPGRKGSDLGDVDGGQVLAAALLPDGENGPGGIDGGDAGHGVLHGGAADLEAVAVLLAPLGGGVDDQSTVPLWIMSRMLGWAWETRLTRLHWMPASVRASQVPEVA